MRFGYRDYDLEVGRLTVKDPIGFSGGDVDMFGYVQNNPVNWIDPVGLASKRASGSSLTNGYSPCRGRRINLT